MPNDTRFHKLFELPNFPPWIRVSNYWYNPHNESSLLCAENMVEISIKFHQDYSNETDKLLESIGNKMKDLECLTIDFSTYYIGNFECCFPLLRGLQSCKNLRHLKFWFRHDGLVYNQNLRLV